MQECAILPVAFHPKVNCNMIHWPNSFFRAKHSKDFAILSINGEEEEETAIKCFTSVRGVNLWQRRSFSSNCAVKNQW